MITYRPDVDGLRAVAVLSVVAYHSVPNLAPGGYVGVDVFFVISGYLITKLIAADIERGRFSVASFYVRRTKRIMPALFVVLASTLAMGLVIATPLELSALGRTLAATAAFVSNIAFWQDTGYFDTLAETKPLLHTWSLAVEEQFYLLWPIALRAIYGRRFSWAAIWSVMAASFAVSVYFTAVHQPTAFFLLPPRAWELMIGAALALGMVPPVAAGKWREGLAAAGLLLIVTALLGLDRDSAFPGWNALLPCLGAALVIASGERGDSAVARLLARRPVVFVGLVSYSLYLWHWPLLAVARMVTRGELPTAMALAVVTVAFVLSVLTWRFVETPLRARQLTPTATPVLLRYAVASVAAFAVGAFVFASHGFVSLASPAVVRAEAARYSVNPLSARCLRWQAAVGPLAQSECTVNGERFDRRLVIWGDSHADAIAPAFVTLAEANGLAAHQLTMAACPPLVGALVEGTGSDYGPCAVFNRQVMDYVTGDPAVQVVALSARWTLYTENVRFGDDPGPITYLTDESDAEWSSHASRRVFARSLQATVDRLRNAGRTVVVLGMIPPLGVNVPDCLARNEMPLSGRQRCDGDTGAVLPHIEFADGVIAGMASARPHVCTYFPKEALCKSGRCISETPKGILYANDDHLSLLGADFLASQFTFDACLGPASPADVPADRP